MQSLLNEVVWNWQDYINHYVNAGQGTNDLLGQVLNVISIILWVALAVVGAVGAVYAIYLGVQLARADEQGKRDDAKKHLITVFIALGVTVLLILTFNTFLPALISAFNDPEAISGGQNPPPESFLNPLLTMLKAH